MRMRKELRRMEAYNSCYKPCHLIRRPIPNYIWVHSNLVHLEHLLIFHHSVRVVGQRKSWQKNSFFGQLQEHVVLFGSCGLWKVELVGLYVVSKRSSCRFKPE